MLAVEQILLERFRFQFILDGFILVQDSILET